MQEQKQVQEQEQQQEQENSSKPVGDEGQEWDGRGSPSMEVVPEHMRERESTS